MYVRRVVGSWVRRSGVVSSRRVPASQSVAVVSSSTPKSFLSGRNCFEEHGFEGSGWKMNRRFPQLAGLAAIIFGINAKSVLADASTESSSGNDFSRASYGDAEELDEAYIVSNEHTVKWRIYTDKGRDYFMEGKLDKAERFFLSAIQEAKKGFGESDPHVASACNNLAELYRIKKEFDKVETLYWEAINILEAAFGPDDVRVASPLHNLGQFYLMQRKLEEARKCYEKAFKIKRRVLGYSHQETADTMYHLGMVLYLQGNDKDAEAFILDSIGILEGVGLGDSIMCIKRLRYLAQRHLKSKRLADAENIHRKILRMMELSKGWNSIDTVIAAEGLALTLRAAGNLREAQELLERCLDARKKLLPEDHIQIAANMLHIARVAVMNLNELRKTNIAAATNELNKARALLQNSTRIARKVLNKVRKAKGKKQIEVSANDRREVRFAFLVLLQSLDAIGQLEITEQDLRAPWEEHSSPIKRENSFSQCISAYKEFEELRLISDFPEAKTEYLSCLKHLASWMDNSAEVKMSMNATLQELNDEIKRIEDDISRSKE